MTIFQFSGFGARGVCVLASLCWALAVGGSTSVMGQSQETEKPHRSSTEGDSKTGNPPRESPASPSFANVRFDEDWSSLAVKADPSTYERLKFVPLNDAGSSYLSLGGQLRFRSENWWNFGFGGPGNRDDWFGLSRLRAHADLHLGSAVRFFVEAKSALSSDRDLPGGLRSSDVDTADLLNAFADLRLAEAGGLTARLGRQELQLGKQRLVSPLDWSNARRSFDGARGLFQLDGWNLQGFWTQLVEVRKYSFNCSDPEVRFYGFYASGKAPDSGMDLDLYWLGVDNSASLFDVGSAQERRQTLGSRVSGRAGASDYEVEGAFQFGDHGERRIRAGMFTAVLGHTLQGGGRPRLYTALDYASGDGDGSDDRLGTFNQLFPLAHAYLGYIDAVGRQNVLDWSLGISLAPARMVRVSADWHNFWRASARDALYNTSGAIVRSGNSGESKSVGAELDLTARVSLNRIVMAESGYCHFFPGDFLRESGSSENIDFLYITLQLTF